MVGNIIFYLDYNLNKCKAIILDKVIATDGVHNITKYLCKNLTTSAITLVGPNQIKSVF